jgi:tetratricopeptide (TPR) repeat protein
VLQICARSSRIVCNYIRTFSPPLIASRNVSFHAVCTVDASNHDTARQSFARIGKQGGLEGTEKAGKHWLSHLEEPWLLIIDNADDPTLDISLMLPDGERGCILITTRNESLRRYQTVGSCKMMGLEEKEALELILTTAQETKPWAESLVKDAKIVSDRLGRLALALVQAGIHVLNKSCTFQNYLQDYERLRSNLRERPKRSNTGLANDDNYTVYSTFTLCLRILDGREPEIKIDATQILSIVAFLHFDRIPIDLFLRAARNRKNDISASKRLSYLPRLKQSVLTTMQSPPLLPEFLKSRGIDAASDRIMRALKMLKQLSLISYEPEGPNQLLFSLHPVVHEWARDRMDERTQLVWQHIAFATIAESINLPPEDRDEQSEAFRRCIAPHLQSCLSNCPSIIQFPEFNATFGGWRLPFTLTLWYGQLCSFQMQVRNAAKVAYVYTERGKFIEAAALWTKVKDALVQSRGDGHEHTILVMLALSQTLWGLGRLTEGIELQERVVEVRTNLLGLRNRQTLAAMSALGRSYWLNGQYHEALKIQQSTVDLMKESFGTIDEDTLTAMDCLGVTLGSWHRYKESAEIHRQVLKARRIAKGATHDETLSTMQNLAMALLDLGFPTEALGMMVTVKDEREKQLGKEHPWTLWAVCNLAKVFCELNRLEEAEAIMRAGIEAAKRSLSDEHLGVLMGSGELAKILARQGRLEEAEELAIDTVSKLEKERGISHPDTVYALLKLSQLYDKQDEMSKGIATCERAVRSVDMRLTRDHPLGRQVYRQLEELKSKESKERAESSSASTVRRQDEGHGISPIKRHKTS